MHDDQLLVHEHLAVHNFRSPYSTSFRAKPPSAQYFCSNDMPAARVVGFLDAYLEAALANRGPACAGGSPLDVVASVINDRWVGLDITISQQISRGAKLGGEPPPQPAEVLYVAADLMAFLVKAFSRLPQARSNCTTFADWG